jgi:hypothetical protein
MNNFIKKDLTEEELLKLEVEDVIVVDIEEEISDFAIFLNYDKETKEIICIDGFFGGRPNIGSYSRCYKYLSGKMMKEQIYLDVISRD